MRYSIWYKRKDDHPINTGIVFIEVGWRGNIKKLAMVTQKFENGEINLEGGEVKVIFYENSVMQFFKNIKDQVFFETRNILRVLKIR